MASSKLQDLQHVRSNARTNRQDLSVGCDQSRDAFLCAAVIQNREPFSSGRRPQGTSTRRRCCTKPHPLIHGRCATAKTSGSSGLSPGAALHATSGPSSSVCNEPDAMHMQRRLAAFVRVPSGYHVHSRASTKRFPAPIDGVKATVHVRQWRLGPARSVLAPDCQ